MLDKKPHSFVFFGRSGAGKGTQATKMVDFLKEKGEEKVIYIETGSLFRELIKTNHTHTGDCIRETIKKGGLLPAFLPIWMWGEYLLSNFKGHEHLIFDGASRRLEEAPILAETFKYYGRNPVYIVYIDVSREECKRRLLGRNRSDDSSESIDNRLDWYEKTVVPAINYFKEDSYFTFLSINGEQSAEDVHKDILSQTNLL